MSAPPRICALDSTIRRSIRAHQVITGIAVTIEELVCNSIDAGASKIEIRAGHINDSLVVVILPDLNRDCI
jgi:DNA mismatch repair ATPase MutL